MWTTSRFKIETIRRIRGTQPFFFTWIGVSDNLFKRETKNVKDYRITQLMFSIYLEQWIIPPPSENITGSFFVCGINFVGITGKIGTMFTGNNFW